MDYSEPQNYTNARRALLARFWLPLAVTGGLSIIALNPDAFTLVLYLTLGLGLILAVFPNIFLWLLTTFLMLLVFGKKADAKTFFMVAIIAIPISLYALPFMSRYSALAKLEKITRGGFAPAVKPEILHLKITEKSLSSRDRDCNEFCQKLLLSGAVQTIEIAGWETGTKARPVVFSVKKLRTCPTSFKTSAHMSQAALDASLTGRCIVRTRTVYKGAYQLIIHRYPSLKHSRFPKDNSQTWAYRNLKTIKLDLLDANGKQIAHKTGAEIEHYAAPLRPNGCDGNGMSICLEMARTKTSRQKPDLFAMTDGLLFAPSRNLRKQPKPRQTPANIAEGRFDKVDQLLAIKNKLEFGSTDVKIINEAYYRVGYRHQWTQQEIDRSAKLLADKRLKYIKNIAQYFDKMQAYDKSGILLQAAVKRLQFPKDKKTRGGYLALSKSVAKLPIQALKPYETNLFWVMETRHPHSVSGLYKIAGKFGRNPVRAFEHGLSSDHNWTDLTTIRGICEAEPQWRNILTPMLVKQIQSHKRHANSVQASAMALLTLEDWQKYGAVSRALSGRPNRKPYKKEAKFLAKMKAHGQARGNYCAERTYTD